MWVLIINVDSEKQVIGNLAIKHEISLASYVLSHYKEKNAFYIIGTGFMVGEEKNKKAFIKDIKKHPSVKNYEHTKDFGILTIKQPSFTKAFWNPKIIQISPIVINPKKKTHRWCFASFDRKALQTVLEVAERRIGGRLISFKQEKISNISFTKLLPELSHNQKKALEIAIHNGYYAYPKKITMPKLAKKMNISYSTYQAHLKKAEGKMLPQIYQELSP